MSEIVETLVIGAGPAGLTAAYRLAKEGRGVLVLERDPLYVGGISRTADWAAQRIRGLNLGAAILDGLRRSLGLRKSAGFSAKSLIESFRHPRRGPGMMWEAATKKIEQRGGRVLMGRSVETLRYEEARALWTVTARGADGAEEMFEARHIVSSAPIRELMNSIEPKPLSLFNARALRYRDFLTVVLIGRPQQELPDNWVYIHDPLVKVGRVQNFRSRSPEMIADGVSTCLGLEYFCFEGDGLWSAQDADLEADRLQMARVGFVIDRIGLGLAHHAGVEDGGGVHQADAADLLLGERDEIGVLRRPQSVAFEAKIF